MKRFRTLLPCIIVMSLLITGWAYAGAITVNSTDDTNLRDTVITLREAIMLSEGSLAYGDLTGDEQNQVIPPVGSGIPDTVNFSVSGTISPTSALPEMADDGTVIDASSQWIGWPSGQPGITLDGSSVGGVTSGLIISGAGNCHIRGLFITNFGTSGIYIHGGGQYNTIGGTGERYRNVISGNALDGVTISGIGTDNNVVSGNYIGTDVTGTADMGNHIGVTITNRAQSNTIGGTTEGERNIISGNNSSGVDISGSETNNNKVSGNYIGTDVTGTADMGNSEGGVGIWVGAQSNTIGGTTDGERNIISGNDWQGVSIGGTGTDNNVVSGNYIGTDVSGTADLGNSYGGVWILVGAQSNIIGGTTAGERNIISGNDGDGVLIEVSGTDNNVVSGNYIGTDVSGTADLGNSWRGIRIKAGAQSNTIGGTTDGERNIISGNVFGIEIIGLDTNNNVVSGNYIGTDVNGTADLGNSENGVAIWDRAQSNTIGGTTEGERNIISGNDEHGLEIGGSGTDSNMVLGNYIGTDASGTADLGNSWTGVRIDGGAQSNTIGGTTEGERNVISGNDGVGVRIADSETNSNKVFGNYIGTDVNGTADLGNSADGVYIESGAQSNTIGGTGSREGNTIAFNGSYGVIMNGTDTDYNKISGNSMYDNAKEGINLRNGGNDEIPAPTIISNLLSDNILTVFGAGAGANAIVEIFEADSPESGEGETYLGSFTAYPDGIFAGLIDVTGKGLSVGDPLVATTTHTDNNTSEFSIPKAILGETSTPQVIGFWPGPGATAKQDTKIYAAFSKPMDESTLTSSTIIVAQSGVVNGSITYVSDVAVVAFTPDGSFVFNEQVTVTLTGDITDIDGNGLDGDGDGISEGAPDDNFLWEFFIVPVLSAGDVSEDGTVTAYDAVLILQYVVGLIPLSQSQQQIADVSDDGTISAYDAALILRYVVGLIDEFPADSMVSPSAIRPHSYVVRIPELSARAGDRIHVPIAIDDATGLLAGGISLEYDQTVLRAIKALPDIALNGSYWKANTELDGEIRFAFATAEPTKGQGNFLMVEFKVLPNTEGKISPLIIENVNLSNSLSITKINGSVTVIPSTFALLQNYPNPFNPDTWIPFKTATDASVTINIYNAKGQLIRTIALGQKAAGVYLNADRAAYWDGRDDLGEKVSSGVYFYILQAGEFTAIRKLAVVK